MALHAHRPSLKQQNKKHNVLGHRTKGQIESQNKGRVDVKSITKAAKKVFNREQRKNHLKQIRTNKREEAHFRKRQLGTNFAPPFLVTVVPMSQNMDYRTIFEFFKGCDDSSVSKMSAQGLMHLSCSRLKQRFSFVLPSAKDWYSVLDTVRVSDTVLFVWKLGEAVSDFANMLLCSLKAQGLPSMVHGIIDEELSNKKKTRLLKELQIDISSRFKTHFRPYFLNKIQDVNLVLRQIGSQKQQRVFYRDQRPHLIAETVSFDGEGCSGTMKVSGYIRSQPLSVNHLVHIPGWGEFQIKQIDSMNDPFPLDLSRGRKQEEMVDQEARLLDVPDPNLQETLDATIEVDDMQGEQTWPSKEEIEEAIEERRQKKKKKLPRGTSDYQSAWIINSDDESDENVDSDNESLLMDMREDFAQAGSPVNESEEEQSEEEEEEEGEDDAVTLTDVADDYDDKMDYDQEMDFLEKMKAAQEDAAFPDELDTPKGMPSRVRFQKYRGLQSFRTSPWDVNENLPLDYRKIIKFTNFYHTSRKIFKQDRSGASPGWFVVLHLKDVPRHMYNELKDSQAPLPLFSLLPYEQKMSLLNVVLKSHPVGHLRPIKSKDRLIFHIGFRRFVNSPVFSEHSTGDKHKFVRFFHPGDTVVASMFAPVTFPPCPVSVFREQPDGSQELVAVGSVLSADPKRIICKRIILSGHPFRVNRKSAVVRYMFFNAEDVLWFKSVELRTKWGRRGHIKEALGTHGHMKCQFDGQLKSQDTILMNLYKRVFPKWRFDPRVPRPVKPVKFAGYKIREAEKEAERELDLEVETAPQSKKKKVQFYNSAERGK